MLRESSREEREVILRQSNDCKGGVKCTEYMRRADGTEVSEGKAISKRDLRREKEVGWTGTVAKRLNFTDQRGPERSVVP